MKRKISPIARFESLSDAEKDAVVREFDKEFISDTSRPLSITERVQWNRFRKKASAKKPVAVVSVKLDQDLVQKSDELAQAQGLSRAELIARSLRAALAMAGK